MQSSYSFDHWRRQEHKYLWTYSKQAGFVNSARLYLENGDFYQGSLYNGIRQGFGTLRERSIGKCYIFSGEWLDDKFHGNGTQAS